MSLADIYGTRSGGSSSGSGGLPRLTVPAPQRRASLPRTSGIDYRKVVAKPQKRGGGHKRSILGQLKDAAFGIPAGIGHLGASAVRSGAGIVSDVRRQVRIADSPLEAIAGATGLPTLVHSQAASLRALTNPTKVNPEDRAFAPLQTDLGESFNRTAMDVRHPTNFQRAAREGNIVGKVLEDAGNIAIVGAPAAKALTALSSAADAAGLARTAAALETAGEVTGRVAHLGGATADAPISVPRAAVRKVAEAVAPVVEDRLAPSLARWNPSMFTREGRQIRREVLGGGVEADPMIGVAKANRDKASIVREYKRVADGLDLTPAEQEAALSLYRGGGQNLVRLADQTGLPVGDVAALSVAKELPEHHLSPEALGIVEDVVRGRATPEQLDRIGQVHEAIDRQATIDQTRALRGYGRRGGTPLAAEHVSSNEVLPAAYPEVAALRGKKVSELVPADFENLYEPELYPARWRPRLVENQRVRTRIAQQYASAAIEFGHATDPRQALAMGMKYADQVAPLRTPAEMAAAGIEPQYLPQGESVLVQPRSSKLRRSMTNEGAALTGDMTLRSEHIRSGTSVEPHSLRTLADLQMRDRGQAVLNETMRKVGAGHTRLAGQVLDPAELGDMRRAAQREAEQIHPMAPHGSADVRRTARGLFGDKLRTRMADEGLEPWPADGGPLEQDISAARIDEHTPFLPAGMKERLVPYWTPKPPPLVLRGLGKLNAKFKAAVLAPSLRWQIGDAVSNMLMAGLAGGTGPVTMLRNIRRVGRMAEDPAMARLLDQGIAETGLFHDETTWHRGLDLQPEQRRNLPVLGTHRPIKAAMNASFKVNEVVNRAQRQAFYLNELEQNLTRQGIDLTSAAHTIDDPKVQAAIGKAVDQTSFVLGDMANLTPIERNYIKQVFPFWPWLRHVYHLAGRLALDHPARLAITLRIGDLAAADGDLPPSAQGAVRGPGGYWPTAYLNPLSDVGGLPGFGVESTLRATSPWLKLAAAGALGQDWNRAGMPITAGAAGTGATDWYGRETVKPLWKNPAALAYQTAKIFPLSREAINVGLGNHPRYATGQVVTDRRGRPIDTTPAWMSLPKLFGVPTPVSVEDVQAQQATRAKRLRSRANR